MNIALLSSGANTGLSLEALAKIRGALWTVKGPFPYGPRPNAPDNIFAIDYLEHYTPEEQARGLALWKAHRYTHAPVGPFIDGGYHGQYPPVSMGPVTYARRVLAPLWSAGIIPVMFLKPDGWRLTDLVGLEGEFCHPDFQSLARIVVPGGWEPSMTSDEWVELLQWSAAIFPRALRLIHMEADHDAPGNHHDVDLAGGTGPLWARVAPFVHGWLVQNRAFEAGTPSEAFENFKAQFYSPDPRSLTGRFRTGYAGWPRSSAWGDGVPLRVYAGEYASYWVYWHNRPESEAQDWGTAALAAGADGALDGLH